MSRSTFSAFFCAVASWRVEAFFIAALVFTLANDRTKAERVDQGRRTSAMQARQADSRTGHSVHKVVVRQADRSDEGKRRVRVGEARSARVRVLDPGAPVIPCAATASDGRVTLREGATCSTITPRPLGARTRSHRAG